MILLFKFCELNNRTPLQKENFQDQNIGRYLEHEKEKIKSKDDNLYKLLSENEYVKESLDNYIKYKEDTKDIKKLRLNDWIKILFELANKNKKHPKKSQVYNDILIGNWFYRQKSKLKSKEDELYKLLSENKYIKIELDRFLVHSIGMLKSN